jgi:hypothetical protein
VFQGVVEGLLTRERAERNLNPTVPARRLFYSSRMDWVASKSKIRIWRWKVL